MSTDDHQCSALERFYVRFLNDRSSAAFIQRTSQRYSLATLTRMALAGDRTTRRAAILSLGFLGDHSSIQTVGLALHDGDRGVRMLAEDALRSLSIREAGSWGFRQLQILTRYNVGEHFQLAEQFSDRLLRNVPRFTEGWYQRGIALAGAGHHQEAIESCRRAAALSQFHYLSLSRMGDYHLMLGATSAAIESYRRALQIHPGLEYVRACLDRLRRTFEGR